MSTAKKTTGVSRVADRQAALASMCKFDQILTANGAEVLDARTKVISKRTSGKVAAKLTELYNKREDIELNIDELNDLSIRSKDSLNPAKGFDADAWLDKLISYKTQLLNINDEVIILENIQEELFTVAGEVIAE